MKNRTELDSVPRKVKDIWIGRFDTSGITEYSFNAFHSLRSLVIGSGIFWEATRFELRSLPSLQSVIIGDWSFNNTPLFSLTSLLD